MIIFITLLATLFILISPSLISWGFRELRHAQLGKITKRCNANDSEERRCRNYAGFSSRYCKEHGGWW